MWKVNKLTDNECMVFKLIGRLEGRHLPELQAAVTAEGGNEDVVLDMKEVKLVDQDAVTFLAGCEAGGARLRNCPIYIREWIVRERKDKRQGPVERLYSEK